MRIAACYIARDAERELGYSIESLHEAVDELVVVDTGSKDRTCEVARSHGARVYSFPWQDDFSLARNFALERVESPWIIFLDSDETFKSPGEVRPAIMEAIERDPALDALMLPRYNVDADRGGNIQGSDFALRIMRNSPELRYAGRIHEMLKRSNGPLELGYADERLALLHTGYSAGRSAEKVARNLALLNADIAENGKTPTHDLYLADCYFGLGQWRKALSHALEALDSDLRVVGMRGQLYHVAIESMRHLGMDSSDMLALAQAAIDALPELPEFYGERGMILSSMGRLDEARDSLEESLERYNALKAAPRRTEGSYFTDTVRSIVLKRLGEIAKVAGDAPLAMRRFGEALAADRGNESARDALRSFLLDYPPETREGCPPRISACYIARNEADNLARSIESLRGQVDEVVVVDTGSDDGTPETATRLGAICYAHPWGNDFSEARNFAISRAASDWIVFLDADEYISPETAANLRGVIEGHGDAQTLLVSLINIEQSTGEVLLEFYAPRIFRCLPGIHYEGRIHEQLLCRDGSPPSSKTVPREELTIIHTGYSKTLSKKKAERNLRLLKKELAISEYPERLYMYMAEAYDGLDREDEAILYAMKDIATGRKSVTYASRSYRILLRLLAARPAAHAERLRIAARAAEDFGELPEFHAEYAECLADALDFSRAIDEGERALKLLESYHGLEPMIFPDEQVPVLRRRLVLWGEILERAGKIRISSCLIVRDEADSIPDWLENTAVFSDERIAVDTGSVDATPRLLREAGCRVIGMEWQGDFAAARNRALDEAHGDWAVVLDADETFLHPETVRNFLARIERTRPETEAVMVPIINVDADDGGREIHRFMHIRFLRLSRGLRYSGRVHERLGKPDGEARIHREPYRMEIRHTGYSTGRIQAKIRRNLALLQDEISEGGEQPRHYRYLADCYFGLGDWKKALRYAEMAIDGPKSLGSQSDMYYTVLRCMEKERVPVKERLAFSRAAEERFPLLPDYHAFTGMLMEETGSHREAISHLEQAVRMFQTPCDDSGEATRFADMEGETFLALARAYSHTGEEEKSGEALAKSLRADPKSEEALDFFAERSLSLPAARIAAGLMEFCGSDVSAVSFLSRWAERYGWIELYLHFRGLLPDDAGLIEGREHIYEAIREGKDVQQEITMRLSRDALRLPIVLFRLEAAEGYAAGQLYETCRELLPPAMRRIWAAYEGEAPDGPISDGYFFILSAAIRHADDSQILRYAQLARYLSEEDAVEAARKLADGERWQAAIAADSAIPDGSAFADAKFWLRIGKCLYHLQEPESASECLRRALDMDGECREARAYLKWIGEESASDPIGGKKGDFENGADIGVRHHQK